MWKWAWVTLMTLVAGNSFAAESSIHFEWRKPATRQEPVLVLVNGLTYTTRNWDLFAKEIETQHPTWGVLRFDALGQGKTLLQRGIPVEPVQPEAQAHELQALANFLGIDQAVVVGLSYGGGVAAVYAGLFPEKIRELILLAPYTEPVRSLDRWIQGLVQQTRVLQPWNPLSDEELYDTFLRQWVYASVPIEEPKLTGQFSFLEGLFRLTQGIRKLSLTHWMDRLPEHRVHLVASRLDSTVPIATLDDFWSQLPQSKKGSRMVIDDSGHRIPEISPNFAARWIGKIVLHEELGLNTGGEWEGCASNGSMRQR